MVEDLPAGEGGHHPHHISSSSFTNELEPDVPRDVVDEGARRNTHSSAWLLLFAHVVPLSIVKFADFITDAIVIHQLYVQAGISWIIGTFAVAYSVFSSFIVMVGSAFCADVRALSPWQAAIGMVLSCFHLHLPFIGTLSIFGASGTVDSAKYHLFSLLKLLSGSLQSTVLAIITGAAYLRAVNEDANSRTLALFASSLALSFLSMVYGFYGACAACTSYTSKVRGRTGLFVALCVAINLFWVIYVFSLSIVTAPIFTCLSLSVLALASIVQLVAIFKTPHGAVLSLAAFPPYAVIDYLVIDDFRCYERPTYMKGPTWWDKRGFPVIRRVILAVVGVSAFIARPEDHPTRISIIALFVSDLIASLKLFSILERPNETCEGDTKISLIETSNLPRVVSLESDLVWIIQCRQKASARKDLYLADMLIGVALQKPTTESDLSELITFTRDLLNSEFLTKKDNVRIAHMLGAVEQYKPWEKKSHSILLTKLKRVVGQQVHADFTAPTAVLGELEGQFVHPMRAIPLGKCLSNSVWADAKFQGNNTASRQAADWALSKDADRCDFFVSHAWADEKKQPGAKIRLLRNFLFLDYMIATLFVSCGLVAAYLASLGIGISTVVHSFPWYWPCTSVLIFAVASMIWIKLSTLGVLPSRYSPWAFSPTTLWLDKCCVLQESPETIHAGVTSFHRFLSKCDGMIAFVSDTYFSRLWCVYELAVFCKMHDNPEEGLLILSLDWTHRFLHFSSDKTKLTAKEISFFEDFSCLMVSCSKPADRAFVLNAIREQWGSEDEFDKYVREVLPGIMMRSKAKFYKQSAIVMAQVFDLSFGGT